MHPYLAEELQRTHIEDLRRASARARLATECPRRSPPLAQWYAARLGLLLIGTGKRLTTYGYAQLT